jgi:hypothetical protein
MDFIKKAEELKSFYRFKLIEERQDPLLSWISGITKDSEQNLYFSSMFQNCIAKYNRNLNPVFRIPRRADEVSYLSKPRALTVFDEKLYVYDFGQNRIQIFDTNGDYISSINRKTHPKIVLQGTVFLTVDPNTGLIIANRDMKTIYTLKGHKKLVKEYCFDEKGGPTERWTCVRFNSGIVYIGLLKGKILRLESYNDCREFKLNSDALNIKGLTWFDFYNDEIFIIDHKGNRLYKLNNKKKIFQYSNTVGNLLRGCFIPENKLCVVSGDFKNTSKGVIRLFAI